MAIIQLENITKKFEDKHIFNGFNLSVEKGEFLGITGKSGAGKSTLLNIIGLLENCEGDVILKGKTYNDIHSKSARKVLEKEIGYLFQNFALIDDFTVYENLNIVFNKKSKKERRDVMDQELKKLGLEHVLDKPIYQLSGGEQQRVALVRLILSESEIILADEPTGSLDRENSDLILNQLKTLNAEGKTIIMVSHDKNAFSYCSRIVNL